MSTEDTTMHLQTALEELASQRARIDALRLRRDELIDAQLTPEQRAAIADIRAEFDDDIDAAEKANADAEARIRTLALAHGQSVRAGSLMVTVSKPVVTWDSDGLVAMAQHPDHQWLRAFMKTSEPRTSIRMVKA